MSYCSRCDGWRTIVVGDEDEKPCPACTDDDLCEEPGCHEPAAGTLEFEIGGWHLLCREHSTAQMAANAPAWMWFRSI